MALIKRMFLCLVILAVFFSGKDGELTFEEYKSQFIAGFSSLGIPPIEYSYRDYFTSIPAATVLNSQESFFTRQMSMLSAVKHVASLKGHERLAYAHIRYELQFNLQRIKLEQQWVRNGRNVPEHGLSGLPDNDEWYKLFIQKFTSVKMSPGEVLAIGHGEVRRVKDEINKIKSALGFSDDESFYKHLSNDSFYLRDKEEILQRFARADSVIRGTLSNFIKVPNLPPVYAMEWPGAGQYTPPGIYLNHTQNAYGRDVFQFNFYNNRYNRRSLEWIYMHEAIPGHHLQSSMAARTELQRLFVYPGNFEGWACYVEYYGKDLGMYKDLYSRLGKWEWDLVRSARVVVDAGIHYKGWSKEEALAYWKSTIPGQDDIAEREVTRVMNWCGQALSYKIGASYIEQVKVQWLEKNPRGSVQEFHSGFINLGNVPLEILDKSSVLDQQVD